MDFVSESHVAEILISELERHFQGLKVSPNMTRKHCTNQTWKINYFSVAPRCLQISIPVRLFIYRAIILVLCPFEVSAGLSYPQTSKPWHFSGQLEQWRRGWEQSSQPDMENQLFFSRSQMSANVYTCQAIHILCHNFGFVSLAFSAGLSYPQTSKPWHFSGHLEQWRRGREQCSQRSLFLCIRKSRVLPTCTKREVEKHAP